MGAFRDPWQGRKGDLRLILGFWIFRGNFLVRFFSFENFKCCFLIRMGIFGGRGGQFSYILLFKAILGFWIKRGNFLFKFLSL